MPHPADVSVALEEHDRIWLDLKADRANLDRVQRKLVKAIVDRNTLSRLQPGELATAAHCVAVVLGELILQEAAAESATED